MAKAMHSQQEDERLWAAVGSLPLLNIIALFWKGSQSSHVKLYALQSIGVMVLAFAINALLAITILGALLIPIVTLAAILAYIFLALKAFSGKHYLIPRVGPFMEKNFM